MRANKAEEKDKQGNQAIGTFKREKALFGFVPSPELLVKAFNQIVWNIILEALNTNVLSTVKSGLNRSLVGWIAVWNNSERFAELNGFAEQRNSLRRVPVRGQVKPDNKACFTVYDKPDIKLYTCYFNYRFIGMPFIGIEVLRKQAESAYRQTMGQT